MLALKFNERKLAVGGYFFWAALYMVGVGREVIVVADKRSSNLIVGVMPMRVETRYDEMTDGLQR